MKNTPKEAIAKLIKDARLKKGYSQQQLATLTQLNLRSVQRMEKAEVWPRAYNLKLLAQQLDLDTELLLRLATPLHDEQQVVEAPRSGKHPNQTKKLIFSLLITAIITLLAAAFLSQSPKFPETNFELFLFLASLVGLNGLLLWQIWK